MPLPKIPTRRTHNPRHMTAFALIFTLAAIGISETAYLIGKRIAAKKPVCLLGEHCEVVLRSSYSRLFLLPNDVLGLLFYLAVVGLTAALVIGIAPVKLWSTALAVLIGIGSVLSLALTYLQFRVIRAWCFWCLLSACTVWLMGLTLLFA